MTQADTWVVPGVASDNEYVIPIRNTIDLSISIDETHSVIMPWFQMHCDAHW